MADRLLQCVLLYRLFQILQKVVQFFIRFFHSLLENSFSSLLAENILHSHDFYQKVIFKLNMFNISV